MTPRLLRQRLMSQWQKLSAREQHGVRLLASLLLLALTWWVLIAPALHILAQSDAQRAAVAQQHAHMLALQAQAQQLQNRTPLSSDEAMRQLQSISPSAGTAPMQRQGEHVTVQLKAVPPDALAQWLSQAREQAQALPIEAHLTRHDTTAFSWSGQMVLRLPNRPAP
jgi:general secretion pathway protein M